jgi:hypothetical protein
MGFLGSFYLVKVPGFVLQEDGRVHGYHKL